MLTAAVSRKSAYVKVSVRGNQAIFHGALSTNPGQKQTGLSSLTVLPSCSQLAGKGGTRPKKVSPL